MMEPAMSCLFQEGFKQTHGDQWKRTSHIKRWLKQAASSTSAFVMMYSAYKLNKQGDNIQTWRTAYLEPVCCSMPSSNCCFLNCIQIFQETGKVVRCSHFLNKFPQFLVIHSVKGFNVVNEAEVEVFLEFSCFFYDLTDVGNFIASSSDFSNPAWISRNSHFT